LCGNYRIPPIAFRAYPDDLGAQVSSKYAVEGQDRSTFEGAASVKKDKGQQLRAAVHKTQTFSRNCHPDCPDNVSIAGDSGGGLPGGATITDAADGVGMDEIIRVRILDAFEREGQRLPADLVLAVGGGVVYIDGFVGSPADKQRIDGLIHRVAGVREVRNNLGISSARFLRDEDIAGRILAVIAGGGVSDPGKIRVEVHRGVVTLTGAVSDANTRAAVKSMAAAVAGVLEVKDRLRTADGGSQNQGARSA
jgi:osmotically-inducible protein OsmY